MSSHHLVQASTAQDAIDLMLSAPACVDSPTQHRQRRRDHLEAAFAHGRRRPEWVWALRGDERVLACVAALSVGDCLVLDHWGGEPALLDLPLAAATRVARQVPGSEACVHLPAGQPLEEPTVAAWFDLLQRHGWRLLVRRHHYETHPSQLELPRGLPPIRVEPLTGPEDPRLRPLVREVLRDSLDAHDVDLVARIGLDEAAGQAVDALLEADPWQCIRLALDEGGQGVGMVSWVALPGGHGYVNHVGVAASARGQGLGTRLLAHATRSLLDEAVTCLVADTDVTNLPMVAAFARVGWRPSEQRLDLVPVP